MFNTPVLLEADGQCICKSYYIRRRLCVGPPLAGQGLGSETIKLAQG